MQYRPREAFTVSGLLALRKGPDMRKATIRILYLSGLVVLLVGLAVLIASILGGTTTNWYGLSIKSPGNPALFVVGNILVALAVISMFLARVFALIRTARGGQ